MPRSDSTVKDRLDRALNVANKELSEAGKTTVEIIPADQTGPMLKPDKPYQYSIDSDQDYNKARNTYYKLLELGEQAAAGALELAQDAESPRAYEVVGNVIKAVSEVATALIQLQETMKELKGVDDSSPTEQNVVFQGDVNVIQTTTAGLLDMINEAKNKKAQ